MGALFDPVDWGRLFVPTTPLLETVVRGTGLRQHGVRELSEVEAAYLEGDGKLSVFRRGSSREARRR